MKRKLRVGLLVDSDHIPRWAFTMLERIQGGHYAEIVLVVENDAPGPPTRSWPVRIRHNLLYAVFNRLESLLSKPQPDAFEPRRLLDLLPDATVLKVRPLQGKYSDRFPDADIDAIKSMDIDVLVRLGFRILRGKVLGVARYGVWSYHHGDNRVNRGGPPCFWEVLEGWDVTGSVLQVLTEDLDGGKVLYRSYSRTNYRSVARNRSNVYWKSLSFLPRMLKELYESGEASIASRIDKENGSPRFYSRRLYRAPRNGELLRTSVRHGARYVLRRLQESLFREQWMLLFSLKAGAPYASSLRTFTRLVPPRDRFWSDPFVVRRGGTYYIFFEELEFKTDKGYISCLSIDQDGAVTAPRKVLERPYHLSYPFVFSHEGADYMLPETSKNRCIELYRCLEFPARWEPAATLMRDVCAVDPTLLWHDDRWWLFVNVRENEGASSLDELFLFHASDPLSDQWVSHPRNPIVTDVRSSRPAGRIFSVGGRLYRPSQDNSRGYGYGIRINRILKLSRTDYEEECVDFLEPLWDRGVRAIHTLNFDGDLTIVDALRRIVR